MLPANYRFIVYNDTGQQLDFSANSANEKASVQFKQSFIDPSDGKVDRAASDTTHSAASDLANGATEVIGTETGEELVELDGIFHAETDNVSAAGDVILGIEVSPDGGTTWPSDATDWDPEEDMTVIAIINLSGAESHSTNFNV